MKNYVDKDALQDYTTKLIAKEKTIFATKTEVGSPLVAPAVSAMTDHTKIYVYVGYETGYTSGNWYYWDGTAWVSGGVYNSEGFVLDDTLTSADEPAQAKAVGDAIDLLSDSNSNLKGALNFAPVDLIFGKNRNNTTSRTVTFTWNENKTACTVNGTATGGIGLNTVFGSSSAMPEGFEAGKTYNIVVKSTSNDAGICVYYYKNGAYSSGSFFRTNGYFSIPSDTTAIGIFVFVSSGKTVTNDVVSDFGIFSCDTNAQISDQVDWIFESALKNNATDAYLLRFKNRNVNSYADKTFVSNKTSITTDFMVFNNKFLRIQVDSGYKATIYFKQNNTTTYRSISSGTRMFYAGANIPVAITLKKADDSDISPTDSVHISVTDIDPEKTAELGSGIREHYIEWDIGCNITSTNLNYYTTTNMYCSCPIKIPKSGLRIGYNPKYHTKTYIDTSRASGKWKNPSYKIVVVKKGNDGLVISTENEDLLAVSNSLTNERVSVFVPYVEDSYIILKMGTGNAVPDVDYSDALWVTSGEVERSFCGVYNIFPTALRILPDMEGFTEYNSLTIFGRESADYSYSSIMYYATILRIRDVQKIVCGPKYTIMAEIFKINNDNTITRHSDLYSTWTPDSESGQTGTSGVSVIDFSQYDFDGFALVAIQSTILYQKDITASSGYSFKKMTTGNLGGYEDVINSVCVEYKNGVRISKRGGMPSIIEENIHKLMNWKVPVYGSGFYVEQASTTAHYFPTQYDCVPSMYGGTFVANSLFMQVTSKSALTCLKNRNGRMRKMQRIEASQGTPSKGNIAYGLTCTNFTSVIRGLKENYASVAYALQDNKLKFDTYDFDYRTGMDQLRPGDVLTQYIETPRLGRYTDAHCMTVESIIEVNGVVKAVNIIEAAIPYCRLATYIDESYYTPYADQIVKMQTIDKLENYKWINRIKPEYLKPITETFNLYPDSTEVGTVMCDRGTDSIYGIHTHYIELSFNDADVTEELYLYKDGTLIATIPKSGAGTVNGLKLINVVSYIDGEGLYTVKTDQNDAVQETFFVKGDIEPLTRTDDGDTTNLVILNVSEFIWMEVWYSIPTLPNETEEQTQHRMSTRRSRTYTIDDLIVDTVTNTGTISIPRYQYNFQSEREDISGISRIYETEYGTYHAGISGRVSSDYYDLDS